MNTRVNSVLTDIRVQLEAEGDVVAYGPGTPKNAGGDTTADAEAGVGGAVNPSDVSDTLDLYLSGIADLVALEYGKDAGAAMSFVFSAASSLASAGVIPKIPADSAPPEEIAVWLGKAKTCQFSHHVLTKAREMS
jgi:hypothetical protein